MVLTVPGVAYKPLAKLQTQSKMRAHDIICIHTAVGSLVGTEAYFDDAGYTGVESHLMTGGVWGPDLKAGLDGETWQFQDLMYVADANLDGKWNVISIENADNAKRPIAPFTQKQIDELVRTIGIMCTKEFHNKCPSDWECHKSGIPRKLIPDTKPGRRGIGLHRQGVEHSEGIGKVPGYLVAGGVKWSLAKGKDCPTDARANQVTDTIIPWIQRLETIRNSPPVVPPIIAKEDKEMNMVILLVGADADKDDPSSQWVYSPDTGILRAIENMFERRLLVKGGAVIEPCTEVELRSLITPGQHP